ncbi:MAG: hypothetical protein H6Q90_3660 [Deltaproteobacteria bacterium]|nr:hypothetical protein [Deltaproteobacteria bacterium]
MSIGYYVACRKPVPPDPERWFRRVLRDELDTYGFEPGTQWDGCSIGGVTVNVVTAQWGRLAAGWQPAIASPAAVLYFGGNATRNMDLWERLASVVLPALADETFGVVFFEQGEAQHRALERRGEAFADKLATALRDPARLGEVLIRDGGGLQGYERLEAIEMIVSARGPVGPRAAALLAWFEVRGDSLELLEHGDLDVVPFFESARPELGKRVDVVIARLRATRDELEAIGFALDHAPSSLDLGAMLRACAMGDARAARIVGSWCSQLSFMATAGSETKTRERTALGDALVAVLAEPALRLRLADAVMALGYDEGLPRLRGLLSPPQLIELERIAARRASERAQYAEASDWSDL